MFTSVIAEMASHRLFEPTGVVRSMDHETVLVISA